jgi:hypothetical protein
VPPNTQSDKNSDSASQSAIPQISLPKGGGAIRGNRSHRANRANCSVIRYYRKLSVGGYAIAKQPLLSGNATLRAQEVNAMPVSRE